MWENCCCIAQRSELIERPHIVGQCVAADIAYHESGIDRRVKVGIKRGVEADIAARVITGIRAQGRSLQNHIAVKRFVISPMYRDADIPPRHVPYQDRVPDIVFLKRTLMPGRTVRIICGGGGEIEIIVRRYRSLNMGSVRFRKVETHIMPLREITVHIDRLISDPETPVLRRARSQRIRVCQMHDIAHSGREDRFLYRRLPVGVAERAVIAGRCPDIFCPIRV